MDMCSHKLVNTWVHTPASYSFEVGSVMLNYKAHKAHLIIFIYFYCKYNLSKKFFSFMKYLANILEVFFGFV